eukprot:8455584-Pyramimonas_sp.AAC.1
MASKAAPTVGARTTFSNMAPLSPNVLTTASSCSAFCPGPSCVRYRESAVLPSPHGPLWSLMHANASSIASNLAFASCSKCWRTLRPRPLQMAKEVRAAPRICGKESMLL